MIKIMYAEVMKDKVFGISQNTLFLKYHKTEEGKATFVKAVQLITHGNEPDGDEVLTQLMALLKEAGV